MCALMPTPKPGQIRCPTCHRPTPPAAFCTQCGAAIPSSAQPRPRGMNREELEERIRTRRPAEGALRRGTPLEEDGRSARSAGYLPFEPEPTDSMAAREDEPDGLAPNVDNTPPEFDRQEPAWTDPAPQVAAAYQGPAYPDDEPYGAPEDAYPSTPMSSDDGRGSRGPGALPIIGFILLCVLALGVGAALASILGGGGIGEASETPLASQSLAASEQPSAEATAVPSDGSSATAGPGEGPIVFPDGAQLSVQPCGSSEYADDAVGDPEADACLVDGSSGDDGDVWAFVVFANTPGDDTLTVQLIEKDQVQDEQELTINDVLGDCGTSCSGLIFGAHYAGLFPGDYKLVLQRNGEFSDSATFTVEG
jgi:hypothetical protein